MSIPLEHAKDSVLTTSSQSKTEPIKALRQLKHLVIVEVNLEETKDYNPPEGVRKKAREIWKRELIDLLKDNPSTDRKILRWKIVLSYPHPQGGRRAYDVEETEELEVSPRNFL